MVMKILIFSHLSQLWIASFEFVSAFTSPPIHFRCCLRSRAKKSSSPRSLSSFDRFENENSSWDSTEDDPRLKAMRSLLENSWNGQLMGLVPSSSDKAAEAAAESVALAMGRQHNILMIDLRLPSYDITEGSKLYDSIAAYDFCSFLSDQLQKRKLIRKSLVLVRNDKEREEIDRVKSRRKRISRVGNYNSQLKNSSKQMVESDEKYKELIRSWDSIGNDVISYDQVIEETPVIDSNSSHRLWSMVGNEMISNGSDMFEQVIAAVDRHVRLMNEQSKDPEDALIILSPYDITDLIAVRRIIARYGQTRTIIIINSRMEKLPLELKDASLVYGILPLIATSNRNREKDKKEACLKVVVMKRFPKDWSVFVDLYGEGFVEVGPNSFQQSWDDPLQFPPPEWITNKVQTHLNELSS